MLRSRGVRTLAGLLAVLAILWTARAVRRRTTDTAVDVLHRGDQAVADSAVGASVSPAEEPIGEPEPEREPEPEPEPEPDAPAPSDIAADDAADTAAHTGTTDEAAAAEPVAQLAEVADALDDASADAPTAPAASGLRRGLVTGGKLTVTLLVLGMGVLSLIGSGASAVFNAAGSASHTASTGTVALSMPAGDTTGNRLTVDATGLAPGDTVQRVVNLTNSGTLDWASLTLTTTATVSSELDTDVSDGLKMVVEECSVDWTQLTSSPYTYSCAGTTSARVASRAILGIGIAIPSTGALVSGGVSRLRVTLTLPTTAPPTMEGDSSTILYTFTGTQRAGTSR
jgi:spore coat-associated protein N